MDPESGQLVRIAEVNRQAIPVGAVDIDPDDLGDWETSGILDVTNLFEADATQIHRLKRTEDLVGACCKAGYDGEYQSKAITNEVYPLCRRELFLSTTPRRSRRQG